MIIFLNDQRVSSVGSDGELSRRARVCVLSLCIVAILSAISIKSLEAGTTPNPALLTSSSNTNHRLLETVAYSAAKGVTDTYDGNDGTLTPWLFDFATADVAIGAAATAASIAAGGPAIETPVTAEGFQRSYIVPLLTSADSVWRGLVRIINRSDRSGTVQIFGTDDRGDNYGPVTLSLGARATRELSSHDLEEGDASKGLNGGLGKGSGNWRLRLESDLDLKPLAYLRTGDGFLTAMHAVARTVETESGTVHRVPFFNPASDLRQVSWLRLVNVTDREVMVTIEGRDDAGFPAPGGEVRIVLPPNAAQNLSSQELEAGDDGLIGRFGEGIGRWQLFVTADGAIHVMSLVRTPTGHLTNVSLSGLRQTDVPERLPAVGSSFRDCVGCPEMVVVPAGSYLKGSPQDEASRDSDEGPVHQVTISEPFAVGRYEVTFTEWDECHADGGCSHRPNDQGWGRGIRPVVDVSWNDTQEYVRWLSERTGLRYRLLSESEWEYAARAGTATRYWWGDEVGQSRANCDGCGSRWDGQFTAPVGSFSANAFRLYDVHGNVWERVQDCWNRSYVGAPEDGRAWEATDCNGRVLRGGGFKDQPRYLRSANRGSQPRADDRSFFGTQAGLRVARSLVVPRQHSLPLFPPSGTARQGLARIINHSDRAGTVQIHGTDDAGQKHGPITFSLDARETRHFNSDDLEAGNPSQGLFGGFGDGTGNWRLELSTTLDIEPSAYLHTPDGFFTTMHEVARTATTGGLAVHQVPIFNPGRDHNQTSWLRLANLTEHTVQVRIQARDEAGKPGPPDPDMAVPTVEPPPGEVLLWLPAHSARHISAQQLESGAVLGDWMLGGLGEGTGKRQLFISADNDVEVVSLLQSPAGHLSNLSATPRDDGAVADFEVVIEGSETVWPLQTVRFLVPHGLADSDYAVLMDLSGTGRFDEDDTIELEALTTDQDRILFAIPLSQALSDRNASKRLAVRVERIADQKLSNVVRLSIEDIALAPERTGFSATALDFVLKSIYSTVDDPLLNAEAPSIQPGLTFQSSTALGLDFDLADLQAEAVLQSLFGIPVSAQPADSVTVPSTGPLGTAYLGRSPRRVISADPGAGKVQVACRFVLSLAGSQKELCDAFVGLGTCWDNYHDLKGNAYGDLTELQSCGKTAFKDISGKKLIPIPSPAARVKAKTISGVRDYLIKKLPKNSKKTAITVLNFMNTVKGHIGRLTKLGRALADASGQTGVDSDRHYKTDESGALGPTQKGLQSEFESLKSIAEETTKDNEKLIEELQRDYANQELSNKEKDALWGVVNEADRNRRDAENIEDLEDVYSGEKKPIDAVQIDPDPVGTVADGCKAGYREFAIDETTSTCVFQSLVEENCYAGSRRPSEVNLGGSDACVYFSLDFFQADGTCRQNYERVKFRGRWTCRWAQLSTEQPHWYTLEKRHADDTRSKQEKKPGNARNSITGSPVTVQGPEGLSATGYAIGNVPPRPGNPGGPPSAGGKSGCHGARDPQGRRTGRWVCLYSGRISFDTYQAGTLHGPSGSYDSQGRPDGSFGSRADGKREGTWLYFSSSSGRVSFDTYRAGSLHGQSGAFNREGERDGSFGTYANGIRTGTWTYYDDGEAKSTTEY